MNKEKQNENKRKRVGALFSILFGVLVIGLIYAFQFDVPKPQPVKLIELDYTGGGQSGGSSAAKEEPTKDKSEASADEVKTQQDESPVQKTSSTQKSKTKSNSKSSSSSSSKKPNTKSLAGAGTFGNNKGNGSNNSDGDGNGLGDGVGPNVGNQVGDGSGRTIKSRPKPKNPIAEEGIVVVEILIDRSGKVVSAEILRNRSTTSNPAHYAEAKKEALKYKFNSKSSAAKFEKRTISIEFTLQ